MRLLNVTRWVFVCLVLSLPAFPVLAQTSSQSDLGSVSVRSRPASADILVDGERWVTPETDAPLVVQLPAGRHTIEVRARGYQPFSTTVDVRRGETTPVNVSLSTAARRASETPVEAPAAAPAPPAQGAPPIVQAPSTEDGFAFAPDFRITELPHQTTPVLGGYGGVVVAGTLLIGAGGYWQADSPSDMAYGGLVAEWRLWKDRAVSVTAHGLGGWGVARIVQPIAFGARGGRYGYGFDEGFWIGEPEAQLVVRMAESIRLHVGAGYRFTSSNQNLDGVSGSISVQFGR